MTPTASSPSLALLRAAVALTATSVVLQAALGFLGALAVAPVVAAAAILVVAGLWWWCGTRGASVGKAGATATAVSAQCDGAAPPPSPPWARVAEAAAAAALGTALVQRLWAGLHRKTFFYDVLSYHLHLPAAWHAVGRLTLVPTPFGDPAPAYTPANAELLFGVALAAAGNASLAHAGQLPFAALAVLAIHATARQLGAARAVGLTAALSFLLIPEVWQQAPTAMADLAMASFFLAALPFLLRLESVARNWPDVLSLGAALGLLLGTKYVAVVLSLPLLLWAAAVLWRGRRTPQGRPGNAVAIAALAALVLACGGFWYVRNAALTGNPLFPATITVGGRALLRGLLDGAALRASEYHLPVTDLGALAELLSDCGWAFSAAIVVAAWFARRTRWPAGVAALTLLLWFAVPYQQSRFFFAAFGLGAVLLAAAASRAPRAAAWVPAAATAGSVLQFPTAGRLMVIGVAGLTAVLATVLVGHRHLATDTRWSQGVRALTDRRRGRLAIATAAIVVVATAIGWARSRSDAFAYGVGDDHDAAWGWMRDHVHGARIAYTGSNLPLPLWGPRFENVVRYVPIQGGSASAPHDYLHVAAPSVDETPSEPAPERSAPDRVAWLANLATFGADWLFVARMYPGVARANRRDRDDFPIERPWADALPQQFALRYATAGVRIYQLQSRPAKETPSAP